jgi:hypothetical protein
MWFESLLKNGAFIRCVKLEIRLLHEVIISFFVCGSKFRLACLDEGFMWGMKIPFKLRQKVYFAQNVEKLVITLKKRTVFQKKVAGFQFVGKIDAQDYLGLLVENLNICFSPSVLTHIFHQNASSHFTLLI